jgi:hypothetical protein
MLNSDRKKMEKMKASFLDSADGWLCDGYSIMVIYIVFKDRVGKHWLADALVSANPMPNLETFDFHIDTPGIIVGHFVRNGVSKSEIVSIFEKASEGTIEIRGTDYCLEISSRPDFHTEMTQHERWFSELHLQVLGIRPTTTIDIDFMEIDNQLRRSHPPFDGLSDVATWLGLHTPRSVDRQASIQLRIRPPVDMLVDRSRLAENQLDLVFHAHPNLDLSSVGLAVRAVPGVGLLSRKQATTLIAWLDTDSNPREGHARVHLENSDNVLVMLTLGEQTVRRHWIIDPSKAGNIRFLATQTFDSDLKRLKKVLFDGTDSREFEKAVASLAFLMGFSPALQVESEAPDLILTTPEGRIVLVECTVKISDFATKLGKLVERKQALKAAFDTIRRPFQVYGILVCALPKDRIRYDSAQLDASGLVLITQEQLKTAMDQLRHPPDLDELFEKIDLQLATTAAQQTLFPAD